MPEGPAKDAARAQLESGGRLQMEGEMRQASQADNLGRLEALQAGEQFWSGSDRRAGQQLASQYDLGLRNDATNRYGIDSGERVGMANVGLGFANLGEGSRQFGLEFGDRTGPGRDFQASQSALDRSHASKLQADQNKANKPGVFDRVMQVVGAVSDIRMKENIEQGGRGLSAINALPSYTYNYIWEERPRQGVMAQDVEKIAPELVHELADGVKVVDAYGLLSLTMNAVKELDIKLSKLGKGKR
jgi:hypothetical protein